MAMFCEVVCGVIYGDQDILVALDGLLKGTHQIHTHSLKWDPNDGQGNEWGWGWLLGVGVMTLRAMLAEDFRDLWECIVGELGLTS